MPTLFSTVGQAIERNEISSGDPYIILLEIDVRDTSNTHVEYIRLAKNTENLIFETNVFEAANFEIDVKEETGEIPRISIAAQDIQGIVRERMEQYRGGVGFKVRMLIVNAGALSGPPEVEENFEVIGASAPAGFKVRFELGAENPLSMRFPRYMQFRDRCLWTYKGTRCKYAGELATCDFTRDGANGCKVHNNVENFGGNPGLRTLNI